MPPILLTKIEDIITFTIIFIAVVHVLLKKDRA